MRMGVTAILFICSYAIVLVCASGHVYVTRCPKPVICAVHSACVGGAVDLACAADIRLASSDAWFSIKEASFAKEGEGGGGVAKTRARRTVALSRSAAVNARSCQLRAIHTYIEFEITHICTYNVAQSAAISRDSGDS